MDTSRSPLLCSQFLLYNFLVLSFSVNGQTCVLFGGQGRELIMQAFAKLRLYLLQCLIVDLATVMVQLTLQFAMHTTIQVKLVFLDERVPLHTDLKLINFFNFFNLSLCRFQVILHCARLCCIFHPSKISDMVSDIYVRGQRIYG